MTQRFSKAADVRRFLKAQGFDVRKLRVRRSPSPFTGALFFTVAPNDAEGTVVYSAPAMGESAFGEPAGSQTAETLARLHQATKGTNVIPSRD